VPAIFPVNTQRAVPYASYRFQIFFGASTEAVAAVNKVTALKRSADVIDFREGGHNVIFKGLGRMKYDPVTLERGITQDKTFINWADSAQRLDNGNPIVTLSQLRQDIRIQLMNEEGQPVLGFILHRCWVSEFQALPDLDAGANVIALEHVKVENEGWEVDPKVVEVPET
jgi:phage tail-like protein